MQLGLQALLQGFQGRGEGGVNASQKLGQEGHGCKEMFYQPFSANEHLVSYADSYHYIDLLLFCLALGDESFVGPAWKRKMVCKRCVCVCVCVCVREGACLCVMDVGCLCALFVSRSFLFLFSCLPMLLLGCTPVDVRKLNTT